MPVEIRGRAIDAGGVRVHVRDEGAGPALLLVHGYTVSHLEYRHVIPALGRRFHVIAPDHPAHGESDSPRGYPYGFAGFADTAAAVLDALGVRRAHVVGHSMGGGVALTLAACRPDRVEKLVLCDSLVYPTRLPLEGRLPLLPLVGELLFKYAYPKSMMRQYFQKRVYRDPAALDEEVLDYFYVRLRRNRDALYRTLRAIAVPRELPEMVPRVRAPTLVLWAEEDRLFPPAQASRLASGIAGARLEIVPASGHAPNEERPDLFVEAVTNFLSA